MGKKDKGTNRWGGGNRHSNYTPMSETEQEAFSRLVHAQELVVNIKGWGRVDNPRVIYGDLRISLMWRMDFVKPAAPTPVHWFDLELWTRSGILLFKEKQTTMYGGKPIQVAAGVYLDMVWDIAVMAMDPKIVKAIMPSAIGLTSRFVDKDTHELTLLGNTRMGSEDRLALTELRKAEAANREDTAKQVQKAVDKAKEDGVIIDESKMT